MKNLQPGTRTWLYSKMLPSGKIFVVGTPEYEEAIASGLWFDHWDKIDQSPAPVAVEVKLEGTPEPEIHEDSQPAAKKIKASRRRFRRA